jgi:hypothetical protein
MQKDITYCTNDECLLTENCLRSLRNLKFNHSRRMSMCYFIPEKDDECANLIPIKLESINET